MKRATMTLLALPLIACACATTPGMTRADLRASLTGLQEVPGPGDSDGSGTATVRVDPSSPRVCWEVFGRGIDAATMAHIHRGAEGTAGPPVVTLTTPGADGRSSGCLPLEAGLAHQLANQPFDFYVNVHTAAFPAGAIRGQLRGEVGR